MAGTPRWPAAVFTSSAAPASRISDTVEGFDYRQDRLTRAS